MHSLVLMLAMSGTGDNCCAQPACAPKVSCCRSSCDPCGHHHRISLRSSCCPKPACDPCPKVTCCAKSSCDPCGRPSLFARLRSRRCCESSCNGHANGNGAPVAEQMPKAAPPTASAPEKPGPSTPAK